MAHRLLRAKQISTSRWLQRVDTRDVEDAAFIAEVAAQFVLPETDVAVVSMPTVGMTKEQTSAEVDRIRVELASGTHEGAGVVLAPTLPSRPDPDAQLLTALQQATTWEQMRDALVGSRVPARVKGRPT